MYFQYRNGWQCQFFEQDLKNSLPRKLHFTSPDNVIKLVERGGGMHVGAIESYSRCHLSKVSSCKPDFRQVRPQQSAK
jgi:hypothetical protein